MPYFHVQTAILALGAYIFLIIYTLTKQQGWAAILNRNFAVLIATFGIWNWGIAFSQPKAFYAGLFLIAPALHLFLMVVVRRFSMIERKINGLLWGIGVLFWALFLFYRKPIFLYNCLVILCLAPVVLRGLYHLFKRIRVTSSRQERLRLWYIFIGMTVAACTGMASFLSLYFPGVASTGILGGFFFIAIVAIAIMRHRLIDFSRLAGRFVTVTIFTLIFWIIIGILGNWYIERPFASLFSILMATLIFIMLYEPLTRVIENRTDKVFSHEHYYFHKQLSEFNRNCNALVTKRELAHEFARLLRNAQRVKSFGIYIMDPDRRELILWDGDDISHPPGSAIKRPKIFEETFKYSRRPISKLAVGQELRRGLPPALRRHRIALYRTMIRFRADICFPFIFSEQFLGFLTIGFSDAESRITRREETSLNSITQYFAAALAHAIVVERKKESDRLASLGKLASGLAHEVRNPLATIKAAVQYIQISEPDSKDAEFLSIIRDEVDRLNRFVERFLSFARPTPRYIEQELNQLGELVDHITLLFNAHPDIGDIRIEKEIPDELLTVEVPRDAWIHILTNLIENAIQALNGSGRIIISADLIDERILSIKVDDSGPGIAESDFDRVVEPFYTTRDSGTGLGLSIVHQMVQNLGGKFFIGKSVLGGAGLTISVPYHTTQSVPDVEEENEESPQDIDS